MGREPCGFRPSTAEPAQFKPPTDAAAPERRTDRPLRCRAGRSAVLSPPMVPNTAASPISAPLQYPPLPKESPSPPATPEDSRTTSNGLEGTPGRSVAPHYSQTPPLLSPRSVGGPRDNTEGGLTMRGGVDNEGRLTVRPYMGVARHWQCPQAGLSQALSWVDTGSGGAQIGPRRGLR